MAEIVIPGPISGRSYGFRIKGDKPTVDEQQWIDSRIRQKESAFQDEYAATFGAPVETGESTGVGNYIGEFPKGIVRGVVGAAESVGLAAAPYVPESIFGRGAREGYREGLRGLAYALKPQEDLGLEGNISGGLGQAVGSFIPAAAAGLATGNPYVPFAIMSAQGAGEATDRAAQGDATLGQQRAAGLLGAGVGLLGGIVPARLVKAVGEPVTLTIIDRLRRAATEGGIEGATEVAEGIAQNLIAKGIYDPEQGVFTGSGEAFGYGAGTGALVKGLLDLAIPGKSRAPAQEPIPQEQPLALPAPQEDQQAPRQALPAPGTLESMPAGQTPDVVVTPPPQGAVRGGPGSNIPNLSPDAAATARSVGSDPQLTAAAEAIEKAGKATVGVIQKSLGLSYPAATGIMRKLEAVGAVSKYAPGKERTLTLPFKVSALREQGAVEPTVEPESVSVQPAEAPVAPKPTVKLPEQQAAPITSAPSPAIAPTPEAAAPAISPTPEVVASAPVTSAAATAPAIAAAQDLAQQPPLKADTRPAKAAKKATAKELPDVTTAAEPKPEAMGARVPGDRPGVGEGVRGQSDVPATETTAASGDGGLGGNLPLPMDTNPAAGAGPNPLSSTYDPMSGATPGTPTGVASQAIPAPMGPARAPSAPAPASEVSAPTKFTGSPTELQVRDALRATAPLAEVREIAENSKAQAELDAAWESRFSEPSKEKLRALVEEYAEPDALVAEDPTTSADKRAILSLFRKGSVKSGKAGSAPAANARNYFAKFKRPIDAIEFIVADATLKNYKPSNYKELELEEGTLPEGDEVLTPEEREFFSNMSAQRAKSALQWIEENLSPATIKKVDQLRAKYSKSESAKIPTRASSALKSSTAIGGRTASAEERVEFEQEVEAQAIENTVKRAEEKRLVSLGGKGLEALLSSVQETKAPIKKFVPRSKKAIAEAEVDLVVDEIFRIRQNRNELASDLKTPLHPGVVRFAARGKLRSAIRAVAHTAPNERIRELAMALLPYANDMRVELAIDLHDASGRKIHGEYSQNADGTGRKITLDLDSGTDVETLLHEMVHAATLREMLRRTPMARRIEKLYNDVKPKLSHKEAAGDVNEFVSYALTDETFRTELSKLHPDGSQFSALQRLYHELVNFVRRLLKMQPRIAGTSLDAIDQMAMGIIGSKANLATISEPIGARVALNRVADIDGAFPKRTKEFAQKFGDDASSLMSSLSWGLKRTTLGFMGMQPLEDIAASVKIDGARDLHHAIRQLESASVRSDEEVNAVLHVLQGWVKKNPALKKVLDSVVFRSTVEQVDPSLPRQKALAKYGEGSEKMAAYDEMARDWQRLGQSGREVYTNMRELYRKQYERLKDAIAGKIDFILSDNPELAQQIKASVYAKFFDMNKIEPYFPLARTGDFRLEYSAYDPRTKTTEPVVEFYESPNARARAIGELANIPGVVKDQNGKPIFTSYTTMDLIQRGRTPDTLFVRDTISILKSNLAKTGVDAKTADGIQEEITKLFIDALPETSFAKSLQKRKNTKGFIEDSEQALKLKAYSLGRQGVRHAYSNRIRSIADSIVQQGKQTDDTNKIAVIEELQSRANFATNPPHGMFERVVQNVNRAAFTYTIGLNVSSALVNLASIPGVAYPYLAGKYGSKSAAVAIGDAYKMFLNSGLKHEIELPSEFEGKRTTQVKAMPSMDNYFVLDDNNQYTLREDTPAELRQALQDIAPLVDAASKNGQLNRSIFYDSIGVEGVGRSRNLFDYYSAVSGALFHQAERANRQVALIAAYKLELSRLQKENPDAPVASLQKQAAESAVYQATEFSGGSTLSTAPRWAQKGIGRVALMFKNYGLSMAYLQMKLLKQLTLGSSDPNFTPEDRKVVFKQLLGLQLSSFALAGVAGMPIYGLVSTIADMFLGDDEEDADMVARRVLGEGFYKGFLTELSGMDISARVGLTGLLVRENRYNTNASVEEDIFAQLGGPAWSTMTQVGRGIKEFTNAILGNEGDMVRGIESMLPAAFGNLVRSGRYMYEGSAITTRRGDVITGDLGASDVIGKALGFSPSKATLQQDINQMKVRVSKAISEKRSKLSRAYYIALRMGDIEGAKEALDDIRAFNEKVSAQYPDAVIDGKFLKDSLKSHERTSEQMEGGVFINPAVREGLADLSAQYNKGLQLF